MTQSILKPALVAGEFDPKLLRPDMEQHQYGASKMRNVYLQPQGGFLRAPGWDFHDILVSHDVVDRITQGILLRLTLPYAPATSSDIYVVAINVRNGVEHFTSLEPELDYTVVGTVLTFNLALTQEFPGISSSPTPGTAEFYVVDLTSTDDAPDTEAVKALEFSFSLTQKYLFVFLPFLVHIYQKESGSWNLKASVNIPSPSETIPKITITQQLDSMLVFCNQFPTQHIQRRGSDTDWKVDEWLYNNIADKTFFDTAQAGLLLPPAYSYISGFFGDLPPNQWLPEQNHQESIVFDGFASPSNFSIFVDGVETGPIVYDTGATAATSHQLIFTTTGFTGNFLIQLKKDNAVWLSTLNIVRDASDATTATNIQTALNAHAYTLAGVTVVNSAANEFTITFAGADAGFLWSFRAFHEDEDTPLFLGGTKEYLEITQIGYPISEETQVNITEAIFALDKVNSPPLVVFNTSDSFIIAMTGDQDELKEWFFLEGLASVAGKTNTFVTAQKGKPATEAAFSTRGVSPRGFPRAGGFGQGRLWVCGSTELPQFLLSSIIGDPEDFDATEILDNFGIEVEGDTNSVAAFYQIKFGRHIQLFSDEAEFYVPVDTTRETITPTNISIQSSKTNKGTIEGLNVVESDGSSLFIQRDGRALLEFAFTQADVDYSVSNLGAFVPHILIDPIDLTYQVSQDITVANLLYVVIGAGDLLIFHYLKDGNVRGWTHRETEGDFKSIERIGDDVVAIFGRDIDGAGGKLFLEEQNYLSHVDSGKIEQGVSVTTVNSGISHLNGEEVDIMADGAYYGRETLSAGTINFVDNQGAPRTVSSYEVGLPFPIVDGGDGHVWVQTLPAALEDRNGSVMANKVQVMRVDGSVEDTQNLRVRADQDRNFPALDQTTQMDFDANFLDADTYQLTINGENSGVITFSTTPATNITNIKSALEAMSLFSSGDVVVTTLSGASDQMVIAFQAGAAGTEYVMTPSVVTGTGVLDLTDKQTGREAIRARDNTVLFPNDKSDLFDSTGLKYSGDFRVEGLLGYSKRGQVSLTQNVPGDLNVTNLIMQVRT